MTTSVTTPLTWASLMAEEPQLATFARELCALKHTPAAAWQAWAHIQRRLYDLVGWGAKNPSLATEEARQVASRYLHDLLTPSDEPRLQDSRGGSRGP